MVRLARSRPVVPHCAGFCREQPGRQGLGAGPQGGPFALSRSDLPIRRLQKPRMKGQGAHVRAYEGRANSQLALYLRYTEPCRGLKVWGAGGGDMYMCVCVCLCAYVSMCACMYICMCIQSCMCVHVAHVLISVHVYMGMYAYVHVCMHICVCACDVLTHGRSHRNAAR